MELKVIGSSSSGNCYLLKAEGETLMIEAGVDFAEIKKALNFRLIDVVGCVVSHHHKDHSKSVKELQRYGIPVLALDDVIERAGLNRRVGIKILKPMQGYKVGGFKIFTLPLIHAENDGSPCPCLGFVIEHPEMGKLLFITDTMMLEYRIPDLNHIMLEANYADNILQENIDNGVVAVSERERLMRSHMEIKTTAEILRANDLSKVNEVILLHLSTRNGDPAYFRGEIAKSAGKPVYVAERGLQIDLSINPY